MSRHDASPKASASPIAWLAAVWALGILGYYLNTASKTFSAVPGFFDLSSLPSADWSARWEVWKISLLIFLGAFGILWIVWGWGSRLANLLSLKPAPGLMSFSLRFGLGICFLNLLWIGTGLARVWYPALEWGALLIMLIGMIPQTLELVRSLSHKEKRIWPIPPDLGLGFLAFMGLLFTLITFIEGLTPESFYDSMVYHLAVPAFWMAHHGMRDFPTNFFSNYPFGGECFFLNGLILQGTETAKMLQALTVLVCAFAAGGWAGEVAGDKARWLAFGLTATFPLLTLNGWATQVDGLLTLFVILFIYCLLKIGDGGKKWALAAGLLAGMALSVKYTALFALIPALGLLLFQKNFRRSISLSNILLFTTGACLLFLPWVIKNVSFTGNPVFPYLPDWFPGRRLSAVGYARLMEEQHAVSAHKFREWLALPWTLTFSNPDSYNFCGPLALGLVPTAFFIYSKHPTARFLSRLCIFLLIAGLACTQILKFSMPDFPLFFVLIACLAGFHTDTKWLKGITWAGLAAALICLAPLLAIAQYYYPCMGVLTGDQARDESLVSRGKITPYLSMAKWINPTNVPSSAHILVAGDARGLYYNQPFLTNTVFDNQFLSQACWAGRDAEGLRLELKKAGVDYLAVNGLEGLRVADQYHHYDMTTPQWQALDDFIQRGTDLVYSRSLLAVYKIRNDWKPKPSPESPDLLMLFSKPATDFMRQSQAQKWDVALSDLQETAKLYSFSPFWRDQLKELEQKLGSLGNNKVRE